MKLSHRAEKDVEKYLLPGENVRLVTQRHWAVLIEPTAKALPAFALGCWLLLFDPANRVTSAAGLLHVPCPIHTRWVHSRKKVLPADGTLFVAEITFDLLALRGRIAILQIDEAAARQLQ